MNKMSNQSYSSLLPTENINENWDDSNFLTYNPLPYVLGNEIIRKPPRRMSKAQKRQFRDSERKRMEKYVIKTQTDDWKKNISNSPERNCSTPTAVLDVVYEENWDENNYKQSNPWEEDNNEACNPAIYTHTPNEILDVSHEENWDDDNHEANSLPVNVGTSTTIWDEICEQNYNNTFSTYKFRESKRLRMKKHVFNTQTDDSNKGENWDKYNNDESNHWDEDNHETNNPPIYAHTPKEFLDITYEENWDEEIYGEIEHWEEGNHEATDPPIYTHTPNEDLDVAYEENWDAYNFKASNSSVYAGTPIETFAVAYEENWDEGNYEANNPPLHVNILTEILDTFHEENWEQFHDQENNEDTPTTIWDEEDCEQDYDEPTLLTYDPLPYVLENEIIRKVPGLMTKSQRRRFRKSERERMKRYVVNTQIDDSI